MIALWLGMVLAAPICPPAGPWGATCPVCVAPEQTCPAPQPMVCARCRTVYRYAPDGSAQGTLRCSGCRLDAAAIEARP